jgi:peptide/nickel transport system permease protein
MRLWTRASVSEHSYGASAVLARLWKHRAARLSLLFIVVLYTVALFANVLAPYDPNAQRDVVAGKENPPSAQHPFGTDNFARDVLSRMLHGARISLSVATLAVLLSATIGIAYGLVAGYAGGRVDALMMRLLDALLSIPRLLLLMAVLATWGRAPLGALIVLLGVTGWFAVSRLVRAEAHSLRRRDFVVAAHALGARPHEIILRHLLPNVLAPVIVAATLGIANVIILEAGLSYLGIGTREPTASWGSILRDGSDAFGTAWWLMLFPGLAIVVTVLAFNTVGDALRDALDPRQLPGASAIPASEDADIQRDVIAQRA